MLLVQNRALMLAEARKNNSNLILSNGKTNGHPIVNTNGTHAYEKDKETTLNGTNTYLFNDIRIKIRKNLLLPQKGFEDYQWEIKWANAILISLVHIWAVFALASIFKMRIATGALRVVEGILAGIGVTAGAHRLYCHRSYKVRLPLHLFLLWAYSLAGQNTLYDWVRDHRVHHKYSETDGDPHNANRGFFFSHCGWLMIKKHPEVLKKGRAIDMSDITNDVYITVHTKIFYLLKTLTCHVIPILIPMILWNESFWVSANTMVLRFVFSLNATWSVNSFAHLWGNRPIDSRIFPGENVIVSLFALGEGWHNYHHAFPWDYKAAELGPGIFNVATLFINTCAKLGLAYDLKEPSKPLVMKTAMKYGDGTWKSPATHQTESIPPISEDNQHLS